MYRLLAEHYDRIFAGFKPPLRRARKRILGRILRKITSAADIACGTGDTAIELARRGVRVEASDLAPRMCRAAREKARKAGAAVRVRRADMREFALSAPVELVICEGDALNHVPHRSDLRKVARAASRALQPGGWFYFDVNNAPGFKRYFNGSLWLEIPGLVAVMRNAHRGRHAWTDVEFFIREGRIWRRQTERVEQVC
jgi:SAM-dependent methyltransferase